MPEIQFESLSVELLYILIKVADLKSINKSSEALSLTQPAISKKIVQLENYYGTQLFIRSPRGMELTAAGKKFYTNAKRILNDFHDLRSSVLDKSLSMQELSIGVLDSISSFLYPQFFIDTLSKLREITITNRIYELIMPFNNDALDAILMDSAFRTDLTGDFFEKKLFEEPYFVVYSKENTRVTHLTGPKVTAKELQTLDVLMYPKYCPIHQRIMRIYQEICMDPPKVTEIDYSESMVSLVVNSPFVSILPKSLAVNKVTHNIQSLAMKQLDITFLRSVSLFAKTPEILSVVDSKLENYNQGH
ncbi:LysR family transcriptional regulator [Lactiplantibacillus pentosus]|jgi:DNA-binding transcriptional LysR family regulator|uniref:LysR family transcriptional regulator n=1 Tax=Lactiplantibacillus pentosus TaxID=1589 RepID=A0AB37RHI2_LACPE|nr:LysR family transcriptional regulator [Lactiplantibacillus pentosus]RMW46777.1 LysR family transcriptional regulator [Lactiplantibacillus pentosus]RMW47428.1 LysR family transcriptional regulator [Lactiplantibacillus pentosus]RMW54337.1 LysR family transcriptional regulator [Lactiplantibacillus pentosus]RMW56073.1 LysR family transcriptional regulator [Lactiplantibacillus pentosus]USJ86539.1 LysR family transcriptional regulator [Lactiplantibacillus pentosus]